MKPGNCGLSQRSAHPEMRGLNLSFEILIFVIPDGCGQFENIPEVFGGLGIAAIFTNIVFLAIWRSVTCFEKCTT